MEAKLFKSSILRINNIFRPYPTLFFFPGIKSSPIWDSSLFKTVKTLEDNYDVILKEYQAQISCQNDYNLSNNEKSLHLGQWEWQSYISKGEKAPSFQDKYPMTNEILESLNDVIIGLPFSYAFHSKLASNSAIKPHYGPCNIRLRIHLGLSIPTQCSMRVADQELKWKEGKCVVFDDTYLHDVVNENPEKSRSIFLLDVWHPEIRSEEREAIVKMFKGAYDNGWLSNSSNANLNH